MRLSHILARIEQQFELRNLISNSYDNLVMIESTNLMIPRIKTRIDSLEENWHKFTVMHGAIGIATQELTLKERNQIKKHSYYNDNVFLTTHESYLTNMEKMQSVLESRSDHGASQEITSHSSTNPSSYTYVFSSSSTSTH